MFNPAPIPCVNHLFTKLVFSIPPPRPRLGSSQYLGGRIIRPLSSSSDGRILRGLINLDYPPPRAQQRLDGPVRAINREAFFFLYLDLSNM
jgi:hypothetical protein